MKYIPLSLFDIIQKQNKYSFTSQRLSRQITTVHKSIVIAKRSRKYDAHVLRISVNIFYRPPFPPPPPIPPSRIYALFTASIPPFHPPSRSRVQMAFKHPPRSFFYGASIDLRITSFRPPLLPPAHAPVSGCTCE